jgi:hypothetical protein
MTDVSAQQLYGLGVLGVNDIAENAQTYTLRAMTVYNTPTERIDYTHASATAAIVRDSDVTTTHLGVLAVVRGRMSDPYVRVWSFQLDGHDIYVLHLGDQGTLIYDQYSKQWAVWASDVRPFWRARTGYNWIGGSSLGMDYGSNIVVGDDMTGMLYVLDPNLPYDEPPELLRGDVNYFRRTVTGQVPVRGRNTVPCHSVWLTADFGQPAYAGAGIELRISDDGGDSYFSAGIEVVPQNDFNWTAQWYSLGRIIAPGRLFQFIDDGAIARIDTLEMQDPPEDDKDEAR